MSFISSGCPVYICVDQASCACLFTVVGCSEPPIPAGGWVRRLNDNTVAIGCQDQPQKELWRLECEISSWAGHLGNCTSPGELI